MPSIESKNSNKKVLIVCPSLGIGGRERIAVNTCELLKQEHTVSLAVFQRKVTEYMYDGEVIDLNAYSDDGIIHKAIALIKRALIIKKIVKQNKIDIVLGFGEAANSAICVSKLLGVKKVITIIHGFGEINNARRMKFILSTANTVVCISQEMSEAVKLQYRCCCSVVTIENGYDIKEIQKKSLERDVQLKGKPAFIAMGRLEDVKGYDRMLRSFAKISVKYPKAELSILGEGTKRKELVMLSDQLGVSECVHFLGNKSNPYVYLKKADLLFLTSRNEGFPNVLIEALACDLPVVAVDCQSGPREILSKEFSPQRVTGAVQKEYGVLVEEKGDIDEFSELFANAVLNLMQNQLQLKVYKQNSTERAKDFSTNVYKQKLLNLLETI